MIPVLRDHQLNAVKSIIGELSYRPSTLRVGCTGSGKTHEIAALTRLWLRRGGKRVWVTAPRGELLDQARRTIKLWNPGLTASQIGREQGQDKAHDGNRVILASLQSLSEGRIDEVPVPDLIIVDEAHLHLDQVKSLAERHPRAKRVGFTATPDRADVQAILPHPFESLPARQIYELPEAIRDGWLVRPTFKHIVLSELDALETEPSNGDYADGTLSQIMMQARVIAHTARAMLEQRDGRPTVIFCCNISHAEMLNHYLKDSGSEIIHGQMSREERRRILGDFELEKIPILVSVMLLTYGIDLPLLSCVVLARPTKSRALYSQTIGRGLRLYPDKKDCLVLDFVGNSRELGLVTPEDLLTGEIGPEIDDKMRVVFPMGWDAPTVEDQLAIEPQELPPMPAEGEYRVIHVDAQLSAIGVSTGLRHEDDAPATFAQAQYLQRLGVENGDLLSKDQASTLIDELMERYHDGWCSLKQSRLLQKKGLNPMLKKPEAKWAIDRIMTNNWKVPPDVRAKLVLRGEKGVVSR